MNTISKINQGVFDSPLFRDVFDDSFWETKSWDSLPAANIAENEKNYVIELAVPGYKKDDFKIKVDKHTLTVSAETKAETSEKSKEYTRKEYNYSSFARWFHLPENVKDEGITAKYDSGILILNLPKSAASIAHGKEIKVV